MKLPFVSRSYHEEAVARLKAQITALSLLLYPDGVPKEWQLLLGIEVPAGDTQPANSTESKVAAEEAETEPTEEEKAEEVKQERRRRLRSLARTNPSLLGPAISHLMQREVEERARAAHPSQSIFAQARADALKEN